VDDLEYQSCNTEVSITGTEVILRVSDLQQEAEVFQLKQLTNLDITERKITVSDVYRPGLVLAGFSGSFLPERVQIFGAAEISYLHSLDENELLAAIHNLMQYKQIPCIIVSKNLAPPSKVIDAAQEQGVPIFQTPWDTTPFIHSLTSYLRNRLAPTAVIHGTLVDVYGVGLLLMGDSGIGKSEIALDLVERGHRLVADDAVIIRRHSPQVVIGFASDRLGHNMEIRGIGIINVDPLFGIRSIRLQKRVEVLVNLIRWKDELIATLERAGLEGEKAELLGVPISRVTVPIFPGKNITVICEVIALRNMLQAYGKDMALELDHSLREHAMRKRHTLDYLVEDIE